MTITTKYDIGDTVYHIYEAQLAGPCPACNGKKSVVMQDGIAYPCPKCNGCGMWNTVGSRWVFSRAVEIRRIYVNCWDGNTVPTYLDYASNRMQEEDMCLSDADAQVECDRRNAQ